MPIISICLGHHGQIQVRAFLICRWPPSHWILNWETGRAREKRGRKREHSGVSS